MFTQVTVCRWCGRKVETTSEQAPKPFLRPVGWYQVTGPSNDHGGDFCSKACMTAWALR